MVPTSKHANFPPALELAEEYGIVPWVLALLDDAPVIAGSDERKQITTPPKYNFTANDRLSFPPPDKTPRGRGRPRASSPGKTAVFPTKPSSPRKPRPTKASKAENAASAREASASLQATLDNVASAAETDSVNGEKADRERVTVEVDSAVQVNGDVETTHTRVKVEMPASNPNLPLPESTEEMIATAKEMVEEAAKLEGESSRAQGRKRKVDELDDSDDDNEDDDELQPIKKAKVLQQELKKQKVRTRALIGVAATLAIGYVNDIW